MIYKVMIETALPEGDVIWFTILVADHEEPHTHSVPLLQVGEEETRFSLR